MALPPGHAISRIALMMRIFADSGANKPVVACFVVSQYEGDEENLYLSRIRPETNCSGGPFKYRAGNLAIKNFLPARHGDLPRGG